MGVGGGVEGQSRSKEISREADVTDTAQAVQVCERGLLQCGLEGCRSFLRGPEEEQLCKGHVI